MLRRDFRRQINKVRRNMVRDDGFNGVCIELLSLSYCAKDLFSSMFHPDETCGGYWLSSDRVWNEFDGLNLKERRLLFLDAFQGYMESTKLYKELGREE